MSRNVPPGRSRSAMRATHASWSYMWAIESALITRSKGGWRSRVKKSPASSLTPGWRLRPSAMAPGDRSVPKASPTKGKSELASQPVPQPTSRTRAPLGSRAASRAATCACASMNGSRPSRKRQVLFQEFQNSCCSCKGGAAPGVDSPIEAMGRPYHGALLDALNCTTIASEMTASCRFCQAPLTQTFCDLGMSPLCESYLPADKLNHMEPFYPLRVWVCGKCFLVQLEQYVSAAEIFTEYAYFSSFASSWVKHAEEYTQAMIDRFELGKESLVVELASNDGYLLQHFVQRGIPSLGIEPAANVAKAAEEKGVKTLVKFFDEALGA